MQRKRKSERKGGSEKETETHRESEKERDFQGKRDDEIFAMDLGESTAFFSANFLHSQLEVDEKKK